MNNYMHKWMNDCKIEQTIVWNIVRENVSRTVYSVNSVNYNIDQKIFVIFFISIYFVNWFRSDMSVFGPN